MTSTISNKPATATSEIKVAIETAVADGAIGLTFAEDVGDALRKAADAANQACGLKKRSLSKRADRELPPTPSISSKLMAKQRYLVLLMQQ